MNQDRQSDEYEVWRKSVFKRDKYRCRYPGCKNHHGRINAHHIIRFADSVHMRYQVSNGITLCYEHHKQVTGKEAHFAPLFMSIINPRCSQ